ncbi:MAG: DUF1573 domain-containing protein [Phycisphaerae bacterium]|nr:DUF1573 domain-containing protein [Phycisphaerae bacterium]
MNTRQAVFLIAAIGVGVLFQSGCGESRKRPAKTPGDPQITQATTSQDVTAVQTKKGGPKIEMENPVHDFGTIGPNKKVKCEFTFKNVGTEELVIDRVLSTCQCSIPEVEPKNYAPGQSGTIHVTYLSGTLPGAVEKHLHILSNDKSNPRYEFTIKGRVELKVVADPSSTIDLFLNQPNAGIKPITLKSKDGKAFAIRSFTSSHDTVTAKFDTGAEQSEFIITPEVDIEKLKANLTGSIQIGLSHPDTTQISLTYTALPTYTVTPPRLIVQDAQPGKHVDRELWVKNNYGGKVEVASITSMNGDMSVTEQDEQGASVRMTVRVTPPPQEGKNRRYMSDRLTIKMKDGEEISVTCSGWYALNALK